MVDPDLKIGIILAILSSLGKHHYRRLYNNECESFEIQIHVFNQF